MGSGNPFQWLMDPLNISGAFGKEDKAPSVSPETSAAYTASDNAIKNTENEMADLLEKQKKAAASSSKGKIKSTLLTPKNNTVGTSPLTQKVQNENIYKY